MKNPSPHYPIIYIEWHDAYANAAWMDQEEFDDWKDDHRFITVHEIGWMIEKDKKKIIVAHRYNKNTGQYGNFQMIPTTWCKITILAPPKP